MKRLAVKIAYLGDGFSGSQVQPGLRTVEGDVGSALSKVSGLSEEETDLRLASRTDKGVNALGNVAVFHTDHEDPESLMKALNAVSEGVFFRSYCEVDEDFNPRHASRRGYRYILGSDGLDRRLAEECARLFVGEHDFIRFCRPDGKPTTLTVDSLDVDCEDGHIVLTYSARYFLWNMVRRTASAIESVASGRSSLSDVRRALDGEDVNFGIGRADALTLTDVEYDFLEFIDFKGPQLRMRAKEGEFASDLRSYFYNSLL